VGYSESILLGLAVRVLPVCLRSLRIDIIPPQVFEVSGSALPERRAPGFLDSTLPTSVAQISVLCMPIPAGCIAITNPEVYNYRYVVVRLHFYYNVSMENKLFGSAVRTDALVTIGRLMRAYIF